MAKIFISFYNGINPEKNPYTIPLFYEAFINGLINNGNEIFVVMHSDWQGKKIDKNNKISIALLNKIKKFNPDLIFLFNNSFFDISNEFECPIIIYEVDSPIYYRNKDEIKSNPSRYYFFVSASSSIDILINEFNVPKRNILHIPFFTEIYAENIEKKYNICFIGTKFRNSYKNTFNKFMETNPSSEERKEFIYLIEKLKENIFISEEDLLINTSSTKILQTFSSYEIVFLLSDYRRMKVLSSIADLGINIWGTQNWATDTYNDPYIMLNFHKQPVHTIKDNAYIYNSSKIGINIGHLQAKTGFSWRVFDVMASNACLVTEFHSDFMKYMPELKLPCFSNAWEARETVMKLLNDENHRLDIVSHSQEIINKKYRFINSLYIMQDFLQINLTKKQNELKRDYALIRLEEWIKNFPIENVDTTTDKKAKLSFKNKLRLEIWKYLDKKLKKKKII